MFTKESLKNKLNEDLSDIGLQVQKLSQEFHKKSRLGSKSLFGDIKGGRYAFHIGGLRELQFNLGWHDNKFRYGLAFSIQANKSLLEPTIELKPFIDYFNSICISEKNYNLYKYGDGGKELSSDIKSKKVDNNYDTFWFYGKYIDWNNGNINEQGYKDVLNTFLDLFKCYKKVMIGAQRMKIVNEEVSLLKNRNQIILQGPPGTGKTRLAKQMAISMIDNSLPINTNREIKDSLSRINKDQVKLIQFHPSYSYEDFVRGISARTTANNNIEYIVEDKVLAQMAKDAKVDWDIVENKADAKKYILIIDEINRANLSSVLGELIYALEYRDEAVESMYELDGGNREIVLPSNLYIIGTMNTADRSVGHIDYAIRRRFAFVDVLSNENNILDEFPEGKKLYDEAIKLFTKDYVSAEFNIEDIKIGHSYFIAKDTEELKNKLEYQVKPLLREYIKDGVLNENAKEKVNGLSIEANN